MKIRSDFVTNSSSTSYCIVGVSPEELGIDSYSSEIWEIVDDLDDKDISAGIIGEYCSVIGLSISKMKDEETLLQFKQRAKEAIQKAFPQRNFEISSVSVVHDGGYDG